MAKKYTLYNLRIILVLTFGSLTFGYGFSVISNTLGQPGFLAYFNLDTNVSYSNAITGAINGLYCAGAMFGALTVGWMCEARGRKETMYFGSVVNIIGGALEAGSVNMAMFLVSRFIAGWGIGMMVVLIPIYQAEISPPQARGFLVGQHGTWIVFGYALAGWVGVGTYYSSNSSFQWRFPIALSCLPPLCLLCCGPWIPESPRWLLTKDRNEEAWDIIHRLHADDHTEESERFAQAEFYQMVQQVQADAAAWTQGGNKQLFTKASYRKRMWMGFFIQFAAQSTGAQVIYVYIVSLYQNLGLSGGMPLILGAAYVTVATISNFVGALLLDRIGRKPLLLAGLTGCMLSVCLETAMIASFADTTNHAGLSMGVFFSFCFISFYGGGIDVVGYVYCSEIFPTQIRSQGVAWSLFGTFLSTLVYVEAAPTALARIKWKYYVIFICLTLVNIIIFYFWCPETKGLSLEEINIKFGEDVVVRMDEVMNKTMLDEENYNIDQKQNRNSGNSSKHKENVVSTF
ncbi:general substrate transporter [Xylogone sp. PMI_703]|nr:general substrate transporter [Xylogone sp. PMI_703]